MSEREVLRSLVRPERVTQTNRPPQNVRPNKNEEDPQVSGGRGGLGLSDQKLEGQRLTRQLQVQNWNQCGSVD